MDIIAWLRDRWDQVVNVISTWYSRIRVVTQDIYSKLTQLAGSLWDELYDIVHNLYGRVVALARDWYSRIQVLTQSIYSKLTQLAGSLWDDLYDLIHNLYDRLTDLARDWYAKISTIAQSWWSRLLNLFQDWWGKVVAFFQDWWSKFLDLVQDWWSQLRTLVQDWWDKLRSLVVSWYERIRDLAQDWWSSIRTLVTDWWSLIRTLVLDWWSYIRTLVQDWWGYLTTLIQSWWGQLMALATIFFDALSDFSQNWYQGAVSFFQDPAGLILGVIEANLWAFAEWVLAVFLWHGHTDPPERPDFVGGGAPAPGAPPGGPGPGASGLIWPTSSHTISGYRFSAGHPGIDIGIAGGAPIWSIRQGTVVAAGWSNVGYGNYVDINHTGGWWSRYAHLRSIYVHAGQSVGQGQTFALGDSTGNSTGNHLHLEIKLNGSYLDPLQVLP